MKKLLFGATALTVLFLTSCKKNDDVNNGSGGVTPGTRLLKTVAKSGSDSTVTNFSYNSNGKLTANGVSGVSAGQPIDFRTTIARNSSGIIEKLIVKSNDFGGLIDSILTNVKYNSTAGHYTNAVTQLSLFGFYFADSIVYNYDAGGKLISEIDWMDDGGGTGYVIGSKTEYTYTGSNLITAKYYTYDPSTSAYTLDETYTFEYDAKTNPLQFASEAPVLGMMQFYSANNTTKRTFTSVSSPADNSVFNASYTYNTAGRPATSTQDDGSQTFTVTYTYQ